MIGYLNGRIIRKSLPAILIDVHGVGYEVYMSVNGYSAIPDVGEEISLDIYTLVSDNSITLYGFKDPEEKRAFELLIGIQGIGGRVALGILSGLTPVELFTAIHRGDTKSLKRAPGVGKKIAERIIVELKDKIGAKDLDIMEILTSEAKGLVTEFSSALSNLGYRRDEIEKILKKIRFDEGKGLEELIKEALRILQAGGI